MKKEVVLVVIIGLFLLSYVLDAVVNPLAIDLPTPYHFLSPEYLTLYPFTTASIVIKAIGIFLSPILLLSLIEDHYPAKGAVLLVVIALMQLYALQDIATGAEVVPLEWALSISVAGIALIVPMIWYFILGGLSSIHRSLGGRNEVDESEEDTREETAQN